MGFPEYLQIFVCFLIFLVVIGIVLVQLDPSVGDGYIDGILTASSMLYAFGLLSLKESPTKEKIQSDLRMKMPSVQCSLCHL